MPPEPSLHALVYVSTAVRPLGTDEFELLLMQARRLNRDNDITGALIHADGRFMQYLEGPQEAVAETYGRIGRSPLHTRIVELTHQPIAFREFPSWQMALAQAPLSELLGISTAAWVVQHARSTAAGRASPGLALLRDFWRRRLTQA